MSDTNVVVLSGRLTRDPNAHYNGQDCDRASFSLAVGKKWYKDGQQQESTTYVDCTAWRKTAGIIGQYCKKGSQINIVGELHLDRWQDQPSGQNRQRLTVTVNQVQLLGGPPSDAPGQHGHYEQQQQSQPQNQTYDPNDPVDVPF